MGACGQWGGIQMVNLVTEQSTDRSSPVEIESAGVIAVSAGYVDTIYKKTGWKPLGMGSRWDPHRWRL